MKKELRNHQDELYLSIEADKANNLLMMRWYGPVTIPQIKTGSLLLVELLQRTPYGKVLNDLRNFRGSFLDANEWLERVCMAPAVQAGLSCFAHVVPASAAEQLSVSDFCRRAYSNFRTSVWESEQEALEWLRGCR